MWRKKYKTRTRTLEDQIGEIKEHGTVECIELIQFCDWIKSTMAEDGLLGLALLNVHRAIPFNPNKVIDRYAKRRNPRLEFIL